MKRRIGDQLKRIVASEGRARPTVRGICPLFNHSRAMIYQQTLDMVIAPSAMIARKAGLNRQTVKWHMQALVKAKLVDEFVVRGRTHYAPRGVIVSPDLAEAFAEILKPAASRAFIAILAKPGTKAEAVPFVARLKLLAIDAIQTSKDGRCKRLYPSERSRLLGSIVERGYIAH